MSQAAGTDYDTLATLSAAPAAALRSPIEPDLVDLGVAPLARLVSRGDVSAEEALLAYLHRIAETEPEVHAFVRVDAERALDDARELDVALLRGERLGPLAGVPFVVKDNIDVQRQTTTCGSAAAGDVVALHDAPVVARLRAAGAVLVGRANMDELAMGASTRTSAYGPTSNPWDLRRSPGGSSGGSAAAVAAGLAAFAVGTDTGGSIREPASQCGVVGMAPSPGLVPLDGVVPFAPELDRVGPLAWSIADTAAVLAVMAGRPLVPTRRGPVRIGIVDELTGPANRAGVHDRFAAVVDRLAACGVPAARVSLPDAPHALSAYMTISSAACLPHVEAWVGTGRAGAEVLRRWELGRSYLRSPELAHALGVRRRLEQQARAAFAQCDVLVSPTMPSTAPLLTDVGRWGNLTDPMCSPYTDCWTVVANLAGLPSVSVPAGCSPDDGMPVGIMLTGAAGTDADLLALARRIERGL